ncbi:hypothetical protein NX059_004429 [Plenodomus lindquistii]|nr:hypothetical protein NX059_004429 [Plenodomus lindquistii]
MTATDITEKQMFPGSDSGDLGNTFINIDPDSRVTTLVNSNPTCNSWLRTIISELRSLAKTAISAGRTRQSKGDVEAHQASEESITKVMTTHLQDYPRGYPQVAAFQSSEPSFSIYRGFDYLHSRVLLDMQDELRCFEDELQKIDKRDDNPGNQRCLGSRAFDANRAKADGKDYSERSTLLSKIRDKLVSYDEVLVKSREIKAFQRPSGRDYRSLRHWFHNKKPICYARETQFYQRKEDLVTLRRGREWASFDGWIEGCIRKLPVWISKPLFTTAELREKSNDPFVYYYSPSRIEKLVGLILTIVIFMLLVLPVVLMYKMTSVGDRKSTFDAVGILVVFTMLFCAAMSLLTKAKRHELFAASAAYCAVLVVFISNFKND